MLLRSGTVLGGAALEAAEGEVPATQEGTATATQEGTTEGKTRCRASRTVAGPPAPCNRPKSGKRWGVGTRMRGVAQGMVRRQAPRKKKGTVELCGPSLCLSPAVDGPRASRTQHTVSRGGAETCCRSALAKLVFRRRFYIGTTRSHRRPGI